MNLTLSGGVTRRRREMLRRASDYLRDCPEVGQQLISHEFTATSAQQAFETVIG